MFVAVYVYSDVHQGGGGNSATEGGKREGNTMQLLSDYKGPIELILTVDNRGRFSSERKTHFLNVVGSNVKVDNGDLAFDEDHNYPTGWSEGSESDLSALHAAFASIIVSYGERITKIEAQDADLDPVGKEIAEYYARRLAALRGMAA